MNKKNNSISSYIRAAVVIVITVTTQLHTALVPSSRKKSSTPSLALTALTYAQNPGSLTLAELLAVHKTYIHTYDLPDIIRAKQKKLITASLHLHKLALEEYFLKSSIKNWNAYLEILTKYPSLDHHSPFILLKEQILHYFYNDTFPSTEHTHQKIKKYYQYCTQNFFRGINLCEGPIFNLFKADCPIIQTYPSFEQTIGNFAPLPLRITEHQQIVKKALTQLLEDVNDIKKQKEKEQYCVMLLACEWHRKVESTLAT